MSDLDVLIKTKLQELTSNVNLKYEDEILKLKNIVKSQNDIIHSLECGIKNQTQLVNICLDKLVKMQYEIDYLKNNSTWTEHMNQRKYMHTLHKFKYLHNEILTIKNII